MESFYKRSLLETLMSRGDRIEVINGRLAITPSSKLEIPKKWLAEKSESIILDVANLCDLNVYIFDGYSTGHYGNHNSAGITLQFLNIRTGKQCHIIFNAELERNRTNGKNKKGNSLPKGQFRITKRYMFYKFWLATKLNLPPRLSSFHDYMGNLKQIYFVPKVDDKNKVVDKICPLLNIEDSEIRNHLTIKAAYNNQTSSIQQPYNEHTKMPYNDLVRPIENKGLAIASTACSHNYELSKQDSVVISNTSFAATYNKRPSEQTTEEWLSDWEKA